MWSLRACRACLATGVRFHRLDPSAASPSLYQCYQQLTGITSLRAVHYVCYECARLLLRAHQLRDRSLRAHSLLEGILHDAGRVTEAELRCLDRAAHKLESRLTRRALDSIDVRDGATVECDINSMLKVELEGTFLEDDSKVWLRDIDGVKQEADEWNGDAASASGERARRTDAKTEDGRRHRKKSKRARVKKKLIKNREERKVNASNPSAELDAPIRRKTQKELATFYSAFVRVTRMTQEEASREMRSRRDSTGYRGAAHKCGLCYRGFWRAATYGRHAAKHDPKNGEFECDYCHFRFNNRHSLLDHFRHFHNLKFSCKRCPYTCTNRNLARQHEAWHNGTLYSCKYCNTNFSHYGTRQRHIRLQHSLELPCALCGRCFVGRRGVRAHTLRAHHTDPTEDTVVGADGMREEGAWCETCSVRFASSEAFSRHLLVSARHNLSENTVACSACGEAFAGAAELQRHRRSHHARRATSQQDGEARRRVRRKGPPDVAEGAEAEGRERKPRGKKLRPDMMCETCGKVFHTNWDFDTHRRKHTGEKPFKCKFCGKAFALKGILKVHHRTHTHEKPYACAACGKAFAERSNMLRHMQVHSEVKPVSCDMCEKEFKNTSSLKVHIKYVHLKRPYPVRRQRGPRPAPASCQPPAPPHHTPPGQLAWRI